MPGILAVLIAKLAGLGAVAKVAAATTTAALTMAVGAGTGVFPLPGGDADPAVVAQGAIDQATAALNSAVASVPATTSGGTAAQATAATSVTSPAGSSSAKASTGVVTPTATPAKLPAVANVATPTIPALPAVPSCVANLVPTGGTVPDPAKLVAQLPACVLSVVSARLPLDTIQSAIGSANLPVDVSKCLSSVLGSVSGFIGGNLSGLPQLLSACLPTGSIPRMGSISGSGSIPGMGSLSGSGSIPGTGSIPGMGTAGR